MKKKRECSNCFKRLIFPRCSIPAVFYKGEYSDENCCRSHQFKLNELTEWEKEFTNK